MFIHVCKPPVYIIFVHCFSTGFSTIVRSRYMVHKVYEHGVILFFAMNVQACRSVVEKCLLSTLNTKQLTFIKV